MSLTSLRFFWSRKLAQSFAAVRLDRAFRAHDQRRLLHRRKLGYGRRMDQFSIALAGIMGAAGIMLTAAGAHGKPGVGLDSAGYLLLIHAVAVIAGIVAARSGIILRPLGIIVICGFVLGAALFAADVAARAYLGGRLFPFAAPTGGVILIISWLALTAAALAGLRVG
jgi:uncharacterized membrane protein YgdD (TMEM256/DUF423 family)